ncbi:MAG: cation:dicarboxylase symporter family transporter, partial [Pseudomonadota bacterium]|nr:cation:dicarboxylase symporter family transporter [Pseudomonadota bacterium]
MSQPKGLGLTGKILIGMVLGIITGFLFKALMGESDDFTLTAGEFTFSFKGFFVDGIFHIGGQIFVNSLKMLVVPLVFISLVCGTCSLSDPKKLGRLGGKSIGLYLLTTA